MALGTVKWFNAAKRYGFTSRKTGELASSFTSARSRRPGYTNLAEGVRVSYELMAGRSGKMSAENLRIG
ncbi:cold shock domain-containing protein [Bradyrhizobium sp. 45]|nr:cold shock domain-containing protein [Bradyrhizobium sp. 45]MCK1306517.1 cold-shock protein [Bradyrhizobium sp. 45]